MKPITTRAWSTPLIIACSLVVAISGILMFFHWAEGSVKSMHEWLGLLFVAAIVLHLLNHWRPFSRYFSDQQAIAVLAVVFSLAAGWLAVGGDEGKGKNPMRQLAAKVQQAPLTSVAILMNQSSAEAIAQLQLAGIQTASELQSLEEIADANQRSPNELLRLLLTTDATE